MPTIPVNPRVRLRPVDTTPLEAARPGATGMLVAEGVHQLSEVASQALLAEQDLRNADALLRATAAIQDEYRQFETSLRERRGQKAWGVTNDVAQWWKKAAERHSEALENDEQRRHFAAQVAQYQRSSLDTASRYESEQRHDSLEQSARATIKASTGFAAANHVSGAAIQGAKKDVLAAIQLQAELNGWTPEMRAQAESDALTNFHQQIIQAKLDSDPQGAAAYYEANQGEIAGDLRAETHRLVQAGTVREQAQLAVDTLSLLPLSEALAKARKDYSGELEDEITRRLKEQAGEVDAIRERNQRRAADAAWDVFARTGRISDVPVALLEGLAGRDRLALENAAREKLEGKKPATDWETYYALQVMATDKPEQFAGLDIRHYFPQLAEAERKHFIDLQQKIADPGARKDLRTLEQQLGNVHNLMGWGDGDREKKGQFDRAAQDALEAEARRINRNLSMEERQKVIDGLLIEGNLPRSWWLDKGARFYEVRGTPDAARFVPEISDADRATIVAGLRKLGVQPTDERILAAYREWKGLQ